MDISTLALPLRKNRTEGTLFVRPSISSVNISYENAYSDPGESTGRDDDSLAVKSDTPGTSAKKQNITENNPQDFSINTNADSNNPSFNLSESPLKGSSPLASSNSRTFPHKQLNASPSSSVSSPAKSRTSRSASRSSFTFASSECQHFVASLKEPKYAKPLSSDEISWIFQDFYLKLKQDILSTGSSDEEMLTTDEQLERDHARRNIESILDRSEKAVTGGDLFAKLFALGGTHDNELQPRIDALRGSPELLAIFASRLGLSEANLPDLESAILYLNRIQKETAPKSKLSAIIKAHKAVADAITNEKADADADSVLPLFIYALVKSNVRDLWLNLMFVKKFRRASELVGQSEYCLTNFEAAINVLEQFVIQESEIKQLSTEDSPNADLEQFHKPLVNPRAVRARSSSQSSRGSTSSNSVMATASFSQRLGETLNTYRTMLGPRRSSTIVDQRFLTADADSLTIADVRTLLREYKRLAEYVETRR